MGRGTVDTEEIHGRQIDRIRRATIWKGGQRGELGGQLWREPVQEEREAALCFPPTQ